MKDGTVFWMIIGMGIVTYLPRTLPAILIEKMHFTPRAETFLRLIPYTAMAALIFPGILGVNEQPLIGW